jgi:hypothetical protein
MTEVQSWWLTSTYRPEKDTTSGGTAWSATATIGPQASIEKENVTAAEEAIM